MEVHDDPGIGASGDGRKQILVVDDDAQIREAIQWALEDEGLEVVTAADGHEGVEKVTRWRPDVLVLDVNLPILDGYQVADTLRDVYGAALPIVMITADGHAAEKARRIGAFTYLQKPFDITDLLLAVRRGLIQG